MKNPGRLSGVRTHTKPSKTFRPEEKDKLHKDKQESASLFSQLPSILSDQISLFLCQPQPPPAAIAEHKLGMYSLKLQLCAMTKYSWSLIGANAFLTHPPRFASSLFSSSSSCSYSSRRRFKPPLPPGVAVRGSPGYSSLAICLARLRRTRTDASERPATSLRSSVAVECHFETCWGGELVLAGVMLCLFRRLDLAEVSGR